MANASKILTCSSEKCQFCKRGSLDTSEKFYANCTNASYNVDFDVTCNTSCCIYLLSCKCCNIKYVGKTWNCVKQRFNGHRAHMRRGTESFVIYNHFCGPEGHGIANMIVKPIELCDKKELISKEKFWIAELNTLFPYGLNMEANFNGISDAYRLVTSNTSNITIYSAFNKHTSTRTSKGGKKRSRHAAELQVDNAEQFIPRTVIEELIQVAATTDNFVHTLRSKLLKLDIDSMKKVFLLSMQMVAEGNQIGCQWHEYAMYIIKDICLYKLRVSYMDKPRKASSFMVIKFVNKLIEDVNINKIINNTQINSLFPIKNSNFAVPAISYQRTNSIRSKVLNYRETIIDNNFANFSCKCDNYDDLYKDQDHGHIITGNLKIIDNIQLRILLEKGLNFHEQEPPDKLVALNAIKSGIDSYVSRMSNKLHLPVVTFTPWKSEITRLVTIKLDKCKIYKHNKVLSNSVVREALDKLKGDFVLAPVDKAGNNIAVVCKKYYMDVVTKEIQESQTFSPSVDDRTKVIDNLKNCVFVQSEDKQKLPMLYATVKMHKTPKSFRYITASVDTILQNLSIAISKCLKLLMKTAYKAYDYKLKDIDTCIFVIDNRDKVITFLETANKFTNAKRKCISTWDFSTLYTKIPHNQLLSNIQNFINEVFSCVKVKKYICCSAKSKNAYFTKTRSSSKRCFDKEQLMDAIQCIVNNSYITFHDIVYRQMIGVPMGTNCAPYLANIYLHQYEYSYLKYLIGKGEKETARELSNTFRYQDDCIALNDNGTFGKHYSKIYPPDMILNTTNISRDKCTFLDLKISIYRGKFIYSSYDKRDDFDFHIVNFPNLTGNIPSTSSYGVYISQLVRVCDINLTLKGFFKDVTKMTNRLIQQGFKKNLLRKKYLKFCDDYIYKWSKYNFDISNSTSLHRFFM